MIIKVNYYFKDKDNDNIYIEFVFFFNNGTGIQRFVVLDSKSIDDIKTYCLDNLNNKLINYLE